MIERSLAVAIADQAILSYFGGPVSTAYRAKVADAVQAAGGIPTASMVQAWFREASSRGFLPSDSREMVGMVLKNILGRPAFEFEKDAWKALIDQGFLTAEEAPWRIFVSYLGADNVPEATEAGRTRLIMLAEFMDRASSNAAAQSQLEVFGPFFDEAKAWLSKVTTMASATRARLEIDEVLAKAEPIEGLPPVVPPVEPPPQVLHYGLLVDPNYVKPGFRFNLHNERTESPITKLAIAISERHEFSIGDHSALDKTIVLPPGNGVVNAYPYFMAAQLNQVHAAERIRIVGSDGDNVIVAPTAIVSTGGGYDLLRPNMLFYPAPETGQLLAQKPDRNTVNWASTDLGYLGKLNGVQIVTDFDPRFDVIDLGGGADHGTQKRAIVSQHGPNTLIDIRPGPYWQAQGWDYGYLLLLNTKAAEVASRITHGAEYTPDYTAGVVLPVGLDNPYVTLLT